jgi:DNA primase
VEERVKLKVDGKELQLGNLDKVFFPTTGLTKAHIINYRSAAAATTSLF